MDRDVHGEQVDEAAGHQWAAEALLEYLKQHPEGCAPKP